MSLRFGTDGVRGVANTQLTAELTLALARIYEEMKRPEDAETAYYQAILTRDELERSVNDFDREDVDAFMCFSLNIEFFRDFDSENKKLAKKRAEKRKDSIVWLGVLNSRGAKLANPEVRYGVLESLLRPFTVPIRVLVDKSGRVSQAKSICVVPPNLAEPALTAAYKSAFAPFVKDGEPVESAGLIVYVVGR